jgi:hypothetical protein
VLTEIPLSPNRLKSSRQRAAWSLLGIAAHHRGRSRIPAVVLPNLLGPLESREFLLARLTLCWCTPRMPARTHPNDQADQSQYRQPRRERYGDQNQSPPAGYQEIN